MQALERPRFRQDLIAEAIEEGGHKFVDVGDPDSGNMFRLYEVEFSIACGMDGERDVAGIVQWARDELGLTPSVKEVRHVIATLGQHGFLDQAATARAVASERPEVSAPGPLAAQSSTASKAAPVVQATTAAKPPAAQASSQTQSAFGRDAELAAGVVVGQQPKRPAAPIDVELGSAGTTTPAPVQPLPKPAEIDLGHPGAATTAKSPRAPAENVELGAPGARMQPSASSKGSEVSLDLSEHMGVKPDDVKEAVRQSRQMTAVEVPQDLIDQMDTPVPPPAKS
ncbi:MAG TPA: hypothetical protein VK427_10390, partial [Kofleriaceae bacterium]|nr:hypothetical protein [Kofleriaceae bacterium]